MKRLTFSIALFVFFLPGFNKAFAQVPAIEWQKTLGGTGADRAFSVQPTTDGGYILAGATGSSNGDVTGSHGSNEFWVVKLNAAGALTWQKALGGTGDDQAQSVQQTADGGYIVAGYTFSNNTGNVTGKHGTTSSDYWVVKLDAAGNLSWQKALGGTGEDQAYSVKQTADGGYIVAGYATSTDFDVTGNHGIHEAWVVKLDATGNLTWQKALGGTATDNAYSVQQTADGGYIVAGRAGSNNGDVTGNHGPYDYWVVKLDAAGNLSWQKALGGSLFDFAYSVQQTADGGYIVAGQSASTNGNVTGNHGGIDYWVVKLDAAGNLSWQKALGGTLSDIARSVRQTADGGYIVTGYTASNNGNVTGGHGNDDYWVVKLDAAGNLSWQKALGGTLSDMAHSVQQTADGGYIIAGEAASNNGDVSGNHGSDDYWVVKLCPTTGTACNDGLFCTQNDLEDGNCNCAGIPVSVDDAIACTADACDETNDQVTHTPNNSLCNDGLFCNGVETCNPSTGCVAGTPPGTNDGIACTVDACDEANDAITHAPNDALCNDGNPNTTDTCNPTTGCQYINTAGIPTLSEWGLIILALLTIAMSTVFMLSRQVAFAGGNSTVGSSSSFFRQLPFDGQLYMRVLLVLLPVAVLGFFAVHFIIGTNGALDFTGTLVSAGIVGYVVHLLVGRRS